MGSSQSIQKTSSSSAREGAVGRFSLTSAQTYNLQVVSGLLLTIMKENNLFNLSEVLGKDTGCQSLFIMLSSKLNKEFTTLRFPESGKQSLQTVSFLPKKVYDTFAGADPDRKSNCAALVFFILRFVAFVSASVASVAINDKILNLLRQTDFESRYAPPIDMKFRNIDFSKQQLQPLVPIPVQVMSLIAKKKRVDSRHLYTIGDDASVVIDVVRGIVYYGQKSESPVLGITIAEASSTNKNTRYNRPPLPAPAGP